MAKDLSDIKLAVGNNLKLNLEDKKINKLLIAGNTINFFGFLKDGHLDMMSMEEEDRNRWFWLLKRAIEKTEIYVMGEIEEKEYYTELFNSYGQDGIEVNWKFMQTYESKDYLKNIDLIKDMKFDVCVMNPPYNHGLADKFLVKTIDICDNIVSIQPAQCILGNRKNKSLLNKIKNAKTNVSLIKCGYSFFDAGIGNDLAIFNIVSNTNYSFEIENVNYSYNDLFELRFWSSDKFICNFDKLVEHLYLKDNLDNHILSVENGDFSNENDFCVKIPEIRGHISTTTITGKADDFYTIVSNNKKFIHEHTIGTFNNLLKGSNKSNLKYYIRLKSKNECVNFINYICTDFSRTCLYLIKMNVAVANGKTTCRIPWFDFSEEIFSKSPREIDDYLFKKYGISDEIRKHIEEIIPDYYNIRKSN